MDRFDEYKLQIESEHKDYTTLCVDENTMLQNGSNTTDRKAPKGFSWIDYWRAMSGNHKSQLECSSCGKMIFVDGIPPMMSKMYKLMNIDENDYIALGGHLLVKEPQSHDYVGGFYIAPLCPKCNAQREYKIQIRKGTILCKEVVSN